MVLAYGITCRWKMSEKIRCRQLRYWGIRVGIWFLLLLFSFVNYYVQVKNNVAYEDVISSEIDGKVIFPFEEITGFEIMVHDEGADNLLSDQKIDLQIVLKDGSGNEIWSEKFTECELRYGFFEIVTQNMENTIHVNMHETYYVSCNTEPISLERLSFRFYGQARGFAKIYVLYVALGSIVLWYAMLYHWINKIFPLEIAMGGLFFLTALLYYIVMPPITGPDEKFHFVQAYAVSDTILGTENNSDPEKIMVPEELNNIRYVHVKQTLYSFYDHLWDKNYNDRMVEGQFRPVSRDSYPPYSYFFSGMGIAVARVLKLNPQWVLLFGRLGNLAFATVILMLAIRMMPFGKLYFLLFTLIPMTLVLDGTYSYDGFNLSMVVFLFALIMRYAYDKKNVTWKRVLVLALIAAIIMPVKAIYCPMLLLLLFIPACKYGSKWKWVLGTSVILLSGGIATLIKRADYILPKSLFHQTEASSAVSAVATTETPAHYTISWMVQNIPTTIKYYLLTLYEKMDDYIWTMLGSRHTDIILPSYIFAIILFVLIIVASTEQDVPVFSVGKKIIAGISGIGILGAIMTVMFLYQINYGDCIIEGVNGRYLLPWLVCLPIIMRTKLLEIKRNLTVGALTIFAFINIVVGMLIFNGMIRW